MIDTAALDQIRRERCRIGNRVFVADNGCKLRQQIGEGARRSCSFILTTVSVRRPA